MMTSSASYSASFTLTNARHVGARVGADLRIMNALYGRPASVDIDDYAEELALLLNDGYLNQISYGFWDRSKNAWKFRLRYTATLGGQLTDDKPGGYPTALAVKSYPFHSYLTYSTKFDELTASVQAAVKAKLPISRTGATEPTASSGSSSSGLSYSSGSGGVRRDVYVDGGL